MDFKLVQSLSTVPTMLDEAAALLALARGTDPAKRQRGTLAASAAVVLAVSLDQGTLAVLDTAARTAQAGGDRPLARSIKEKLSESLRRRVVQLPEIVTGGKFRLNGENGHVRALHDLITLRNALLHVFEEPDDTLLSLDLKTPTPAAVQRPSQVYNAWLTVRLDDVERYRTAVHVYVDEVLFPPSNQIRKGGIVVSSPES
jgi:hypothetical protein